jgi:hypothetical protein
MFVIKPMFPELLIKEEAVTDKKLHLFSLYVDLPASVCARWATSMINRQAGPHWRTSSEMWKIDSLRSSASIRQMTINDAANADIIIVAASSLAQPEPALLEWLDALAARKNNHPAAPGLLIGLLGDDATRTEDLNWTVRPLIRCAQQIGREFFWQWMGDGAMNSAEWLAEDVKNLLDRKSVMGSAAAA